MVRSPRRFFALVMFAALGSTGCLQALEITRASLELTALVAQAIPPSLPAPPQEPTACCYAAQEPTPVEGAVDRPMTECELARGRHREAHQEQDDVPAELRCTAEGAYPSARLTRPRVADPRTSPPPTTAAGTPADVTPPDAPAQASPSTPDLL